MTARTSKSLRFTRGVRQTDFTPSKGNALQACIASILGLDLEDVPNFIASEGDLYDALRSFLATKGLGFIKIPLDEEGCVPFAPGAANVRCVLAGQSPRGAHKHVVVAEIASSSTTPVPVFDPHPSEQFLSSFIWVGLFVILTPDDYTKKLSQDDRGRVIAVHPPESPSVEGVAAAEELT